MAPTAWGAPELLRQMDLSASQCVVRFLSCFGSQMFLLFHKNEGAWTRLGKCKFKSICLHLLLQYEQNEEV